MTPQPSPHDATTSPETFPDRLTFLAARLESRAGVTVIPEVGVTVAKALRAIAADLDAERLADRGDLVDRLAAHLTVNGGVALFYAPGGRFAASSSWGREAPDSDMAGAAAYGMGDTLAEALGQLLDEAGVSA